MRPKILSRVLSASSVALLFGWLMHHTSVRDFSMGKEAYLAQSAHHFDSYIIRSARSPIVGIAAAVIFIGFSIGLYEFFAFLFEKLVSFDTPSEQNQRLGQGF